MLTAVVLSTILIIGLKPKDFSPPNNAAWLNERPGIRFERSGIAYTDSIADLIHEHISPERGFSIEIALKPKSYQEDGFNFIFLIHGGNDRRQFLIGQWRDALIVMNGDDYDNHRKTKRISLKSTSAVPTVQLLTLTSDAKGSKIYMNGSLVRRRKDLQLEIPNENQPRLLLGNSVYGNHSWQGEIYGVAIFGKVLSKRDVETHFQAWSENPRFPFAKQPLPFILFPFEENGGTLAKNYPDETHPLYLPSLMKILSPRIFPRYRFEQLFNWNIFTNNDALLNFFGFIPLGFLLSITLLRLGEGSKRHYIAITIAAGFLVSLFIETIQAWIPDRNSDLQDLILNTAGTLVGAIICKYFTRVQTEY